MTERKIFWYLPRIAALVAALSGVTLFMMNSEIISRSVQSVLNLEIDPSYVGGRVSVVAYDPVGDDTGFGALEYPTHPDFAPRSLDLVRYTVHEPVYDAKWQALAEYWQLNLSFASGPARVRNVRIYIDADGDGKGNAVPRDEMAEGVTFDPAHPWDYAVAVEGLEGKLVSADGKLNLPVEVTASADGKDLSVRIPLADRRLHLLYLAERTWQYVYVGGWTPWERDGFIPVGERASAGSGGGAPSGFTPKIYDCLVPDGKTQAEILSAWDEDSFSVPVLYPVEIPLRSVRAEKKGKSGSVAATAASKIAELEALAKAEAETAAAAAWAEYESFSVKEGMEFAVAAFGSGARDEAEAAFDRILSSEPENPTALAYKGSLVALRGAEATPLAAVEIIAEAYRLLDRAVALAKTSGEIIASRLNRGNVSKSIPETVFGKALGGAEDFLVAAEEFRKLDPLAHRADIAEAWFNAAICFETGGKKSEAGTWLREAARVAWLPSAGEGSSTAIVSVIPASLVLELTMRGFPQP